MSALALALSFALLLLLRVPVAFALGLVGAAGLCLRMPTEPALVTSAQRIATSLDSFPLLAIPFFILAGELMHRGGTARRLVVFARTLLAGLPGGLLHVHVLASMLFGAISGSAVASASAVGSVMAPHLEEEGHPKGLGAAVNVSAATTGLLIPPSNILIVYSLASGGVSVAALFLAGYLPGLLVGGGLMMAAAWLARGRPVAPRSLGAEVLGAASAALPGLGLPVLVMGGIVGGVFTATEASALAVLYAAGLGFAYRELAPRDLPAVLYDAAVTTGTVMLLVATSMALSWLLAYERIPQHAAEALLALAADPLGVLLVVNLTLLAVGTFMDMTPAVLIFTPIFLPVATALGVDPVHFGIVMVFNLCIGLCTPPVGTVLFVGAGVAGVRLQEVVRYLLPLYGVMLLGLVAVSAWPALSLWLPRMLGY